MRWKGQDRRIMATEHIMVERQYAGTKHTHVIFISPSFAETPKFPT